MAPQKSIPPRARPVQDLSPTAEEGDQMHIRKFADGGMVRGCKSMQSSGKGFKGTY